jgi:hypothetical protein
MAADYVKRMHDFRNDAPERAATPQRRPKSNPLAVDRTYTKAKRLQADLTRHYEACIVSRSALRFKNIQRRKAYCASIAWEIVRQSGRYRDYPRFRSSAKEVIMARRKRKTPPRDRFGHFLSKRRVAAKRKKAAKKRPAAKPRKSGWSPKRRRASKLKGQKHTVRRHTRRVKRGKRVTVRKHMSKEEVPMKRRRRARRARRSRELAYENPRPRRRRKRRAARETIAAPNPRKRAKPKRRAAPRSRRRRVAVLPTIVRRRTRKGGRRKARAGLRRIYVVAAPRKRRRSSKKRKSSSKRRKTSKRRSRRLPTYYTPSSHQLMENPLGSGLESPMSGGELALAFGTGLLGYVSAEVLDRFLATTANATDDASKAQESIANRGLVQAAPDLKRAGAQMALAAIPFIGAYYVHNPMGRASLQGFGLGAGFRFLGQLVRTYVIGKFLKDNTMAQRLYGDTIDADNAEATLLDIQTNMVPQKVGTAGPPRALGVGTRPYGVGDVLTAGGSVTAPAQRGVTQGSGSAYATGGGVVTASGSATAGGGGGPVAVAGGNGTGITPGPGGAVYSGGSAYNGPLPGAVPYPVPICGGGAQFSPLTPPLMPGQPVPIAGPMPQAGSCAPCGAETMEGARSDAAATAQRALDKGLSGPRPGSFDVFNIFPED